MIKSDSDKIGSKITVISEFSAVHGAPSSVFLNTVRSNKQQIPNLKSKRLMLVRLRIAILQITDINLAAYNVWNTEHRQTTPIIITLDGCSVSERFRKIFKPCDSPTLRHRTNLGLFLGFAAGALGEELVHQGLFQFRGERDQAFLLFNGALDG